MAEYREFKDGELIAGTRYQVQRLIGVGGMGTVYEVEHVELGKRFVLKALLRELSRREDLVIRLRNEWRALGRLEHPNIVTVTDAGTSATGVPFYVMERLEGETLSLRMRRTKRFPVREAVEVAAGVLEGLAAAHQIGVVHRDVKPPNIFLVGEGKPKVLDFGVAKIVDDPGVVTARGIAVGTPRYMSPEQARGEHVDGRADVYSTGLILFEMVTGVSPFEEARDANEIILGHLVRRPVAVSSLAPGVPTELDAVAACMLEKKRDDRPASALDAARRLREIAAQLAPPSSGRFSSLPPASARLSSKPPRPSSAPKSGPNDATLLPAEGGRLTTRPDGIASAGRRSTLTSGSMTGDVLGGGSMQSVRSIQSAHNAQSPCAEAQRPLGRGSAPVPDTLFSPPSFASPSFAYDATEPAPPPSHGRDSKPLALRGQPPSQRKPPSQNGDRVHTEILTGVPQEDPAPTRTRYPSPTLSETPPPVTPTPKPGVNPFRPKPSRTQLVIASMSALALASIGGIVLLRSGSARSGSAETPADVHAARPAPGAPTLHRTASPTAVAAPPTTAAPNNAPTPTEPASPAALAAPPNPAETPSADSAASGSKPARSDKSQRKSAATRPSAASSAGVPASPAQASAARPAGAPAQPAKRDLPSLPSSGL